MAKVTDGDDVSVIGAGDSSASSAISVPALNNDGSEGRQAREGNLEAVSVTGFSSISPGAKAPVAVIDGSNVAYGYGHSMGKKEWWLEGLLVAIQVIIVLCFCVLASVFLCSQRFASLPTAKHRAWQSGGQFRLTRGARCFRLCSAPSCATSPPTYFSRLTSVTIILAVIIRRKAVYQGGNCLPASYRREPWYFCVVLSTIGAARWLRHACAVPSSSVSNYTSPCPPLSYRR